MHMRMCMMPHPQTLAACGSQAWSPLVVSLAMDLTSQALHTGVRIHINLISYLTRISTSNQLTLGLSVYISYHHDINTKGSCLEETETAKRFVLGTNRGSKLLPAISLALALKLWL